MEGEGLLPHNYELYDWIGAAVKGMVFNQFSGGWGGTPT